ncbi:MBL fold metallo-hydrolase [Acinetobacter qingfengensis]|uniref:MBL fold metallo-hydrolase n=1 Tax=Acinetobacter qingfengensis TaxID=1262585 RepID=A0A1E7R1H5_9GAMM|nr:MBL fold metallo-hydrolase [Acinetobacter qingfengensis]KAA8733226.1 MBL fold metallo-hydrolase [Acinetobacter qingfengensis]OEY93141.1 MBL fold metallo-hydrolase [Acinetobacter qingfengensis]
MLHCQIVAVTAFSQNCSILWDDETMQAVLIDAGGEAERLQQMITDLGVTVIALWNTHGHLDHIGAVGALAKTYNVPVIGPNQQDSFWIDMLQDVSRQYGFPIPEPVQVDQWLAGGEILSLGKYRFEVRFTPGHTPGHVVFYCAELNMLWTGDVLFKGSIGRTDFPKGDFDTLIHSIQTQLLTLPDETQFISGHGATSSIGLEKQFNPFLKGI